MTRTNIEQGAEVIVTGSAIFDGRDAAASAAAMLDAVRAGSSTLRQQPH